MPDSTERRRTHPTDDELFAPAHEPALRTATEDLCWLLGRGYADDASLKLVGDRHELVARQRKAVFRASCTAEAAARRRASRRHAVAGSVAVDGFNCVILTESLLSGAPVFRGRDGSLRDLASVHGTWDRVSETQRAIELLAATLAPANDVTWWLDRPVSHSGRLAGMLRDIARANGVAWSVELVNNPDVVLAESKGLVATADAWILDRAEAWIDLPGLRIPPDARLIDLSAGATDA